MLSFIPSGTTKIVSFVMLIVMLIVDIEPKWPLYGGPVTLMKISMCEPRVNFNNFFKYKGRG